MNIKAAYMVPHPPLIVPAVGKGEERTISATIESYQKVAEKIKKLAPDTVVIVSPHSVMYADYFHISPGDEADGSFAMFRAPEVAFHIQYDRQFTDALTTLAEKNNVMAGILGERDPSLDHGTMVPLYFIKEAFGEALNCKFVRIGLSGLSLEEHYKLGQLIQQAARELNRQIVFIASGDLSHRLKEDGPYGFQKEGPIYDEKIMQVMGQADFETLLCMDEELLERAGECGHRSFCMLAGVLDGIKVEAKRLSYEGPFGVGYGIVTYHPVEEEKERKLLEVVKEKKRKEVLQRKEQEDAYVRLARKALEKYVLTGIVLNVPEGLPEALLKERAGAFVSLKKGGRLRGCIGTIGPTRETLAEEIIANAINAAVNDPRFEPVEEEELEELVISVDVLGEAEKIESPNQLEVKRYGVIVTKGYKRGLLLPNLDGIDTVEEQIKIAKQKAGIEDEEPVQLERFEVIRHH